MIMAGCDRGEVAGGELYDSTEEGCSRAAAATDASFPTETSSPPVFRLNPFGFIRIFRGTSWLVAGGLGNVHSTPQCSYYPYNKLYTQ